LPILDGFNWSEWMAITEDIQVYVVVFRSVRRESADSERLEALDEAAYREALRASGLVYYFRGHLMAGRRSLSFCVWESQHQAHAASGMEAHGAAAHAAYDMYASFDLERWVLTKRSDSSRLELRPAPNQASKSRSGVTSRGAVSAGLQVDSLPE
jgi:hypothetical protein